MGNKVYLVWASEEYEESWLWAVYSTHELALQHKERCPRYGNAHVYIEEMEILTELTDGIDICNEIDDESDLSVSDHIALANESMERMLEERRIANESIHEVVFVLGEVDDDC